MPINKFERDRIDNTQAQVNLSVNSAQDWVEITDKKDATNNLFLQGHEASEFIAKAKEFYKKSKVISLEEAQYYIAWDYLEVVFHS